MRGQLENCCACTNTNSPSNERGVYSSASLGRVGGGGAVMKWVVVGIAVACGWVNANAPACPREEDGGFVCDCGGGCEGTNGACDCSSCGSCQDCNACRCCRLVVTTPVHSPQPSPRRALSLIFWPHRHYHPRWVLYAAHGRIAPLFCTVLMTAMCLLAAHAFLHGRIAGHGCCRRPSVRLPEEWAALEGSDMFAFTTEHVSDNLKPNYGNGYIATQSVSPPPTPSHALTHRGDQACPLPFSPRSHYHCLSSIQHTSGTPPKRAIIA